MNPSSLVPVEGEIARPRFTPLDGIPFGREWTFRGASDAHADNAPVARIVTSCIDVTFPHRACNWLPLRLQRPPAPGPALPPPHPASAGGSRRAMFAACWSVGALGIIGWLVAAHAPQSSTDASLHFARSGAVIVQQPAQPVAHVATPALQPAAASRTPTAIAARPSPSIVVAPHPPAPTRPVPTRHAQRPATAPQPRATGARAMPPQYVTARSVPAAARVAAHVRPMPQLQRAVPRLSAVPAPAPEALDDPRTLIAMARALRTEQPAATPSASPEAGFDWTSRLSHRRLTDSPDAFTR
ncbi:hypothetical protein [Burkholderia stagnalis]|uniref:hypothetical protein n=1 Tax=Burkholderia stagnalis TaxID=1503054 RepID=UPI0007C7AFB9|nr:hypothetical protein [Burkholderia stagnalis]